MQFHEKWSLFSSHWCSRPLNYRVYWTEHCREKDVVHGKKVLLTECELNSAIIISIMSFPILAYRLVKELNGKIVFSWTIYSWKYLYCNINELWAQILKKKIVPNNNNVKTKQFLNLLFLEDEGKKLSCFRSHNHTNIIITNISKC